MFTIARTDIIDIDLMFASGLIVNITPRQTAGADGPKSVRNVMTGRIGGWYQGPERVEAAPGGGRRRFDLVDRSGGRRVAPRDRVMMRDQCGRGGPPSDGAEPSGLGEAREGTAAG